MAYANDQWTVAYLDVEVTTIPWGIYMNVRSDMYLSKTKVYCGFLDM
jgi:hypothetical protein